MLYIRLHGNRYNFTPKFIPTIIALIMLGILISLGFWQLYRAEVKRNLFIEFAARAKAKPLTALPNKANPRLQFHPVFLKGHYNNQHQFLLDNRIYNHHVGYDVLTPFAVAGTKIVLLVNRGWIPRGESRQTLPTLKHIPAYQRIKGVLKMPTKKGLVLSQQQENPNQWPSVIQKIILSQQQQQLGKSLYPYLILLSPKAPNGFTRTWKLVTISPAKHMGYAFQWFALALALLILYIVVNLKKEKRS